MIWFYSRIHQKSRSQVRFFVLPLININIIYSYSTFRIGSKSNISMILEFHFKHRKFYYFSSLVITCPALLIVGAAHYYMVVSCFWKEAQVSLRRAAVRARMAVDRAYGFNTRHHIKFENCIRITGLSARQYKNFSNDTVFSCKSPANSWGAIDLLTSRIKLRVSRAIPLIS